MCLSSVFWDGTKTFPFSRDISAWDTSSVTDARWMFDAFDKLPLEFRPTFGPDVRVGNDSDSDSEI